MFRLKTKKLELMPNKTDWDKPEKNIVGLIDRLFGNAVIYSKRVKNTEIPLDGGKKLIDIIAVVTDFNSITANNDIFTKYNLEFCGENMEGHLLYFVKDIDDNSYHINVVMRNNMYRNDYMDFKDYLSFYSEKAETYRAIKRELFSKFSNDLGKYINERQKVINTFVTEAKEWRESLRI